MTDISADFNLEPEVSLTADFELNPNPSMEVSYRLNTFENDHTQLINRDVSGQHPISAITGLRDELDSISEDITLVEDNLTQSITDEKDRAELAEGNLSDAISDESTARQNADNTLTANLANEVNARISADTSLTTLLGATNQTLNTHIADINNPHQVTKTQLGLGNVDNTSDMNKPISTATQAALDGMVTIATGQTISGAKTFSNTVTMAGQTPIAASHNYNSYAVFQRLPNTREQIFSNGGDKVRFRGSETRPQYNGNDLALYSDVTAEGADLTAHINNKNNPHEVTKAQVGLGNVSNLAPADLPISTATQSALDVVNGDIDNIEGLIPNQATTSNQLADKSFVNSSISTNTANFIGTFNSVAELEAYSGTVTNNDYAFVETTDTAGNTLYDRYKYTDSTNSWQFEYELNNSSFTANQWAAINSGATLTNIGQIATNTSSITSINTTIGGYGNIVTYDVDDFATAAQGDKADTALQSGDNISELVNNSGYITSASISSLSDVDLSNLSNGQGLLYNSTSQKWENGAISSSATWGSITGSLYNQTDLANALAAKQNNLTEGTGIDITGNEISVIAPVLINNEQQNLSDVNISPHSVTPSAGSVSIFSSGVMGLHSVAIGNQGYASGNQSVAIGYTAIATKQNSIQLGRGTNATANSFQVGSYTLLDTSTGIIPNARISGKQDTLVSGTNIKTINNNSILGSGDLAIDGLPSQTGQSGKFLTTDGTDASWATVGALPSQTGQSGKFLTTDGTDASWANVDALPSQTGHSGDVLTTDGTDASWVDTDTIYPVIETYVNGTDWYRVYSDGWVEQGGAMGTNSTVTLLKPMANANYYVDVTWNGGKSGNFYAGDWRIDTLTTTSFYTTATSNGANVKGSRWIVKGYGA